MGGLQALQVAGKQLGMAAVLALHSAAVWHNRSKKPFHLAGQRLQLGGTSFKLFSGLGLECSVNATNAMLTPSNCS